MPSKKPIIGTNIQTGEEVEFTSAHEAFRILSSKGLKISRANIVYVCLGKPVWKGSNRPNPTMLKQSGGYTWKFKNT